MASTKKWNKGNMSNEEDPSMKNGKQMQNSDRKSVVEMSNILYWEMTSKVGSEKKEKKKWDKRKCKNQKIEVIIYVPKCGIYKVNGTIGEIIGHQPVSVLLIGDQIEIFKTYTNNWKGVLSQSQVIAINLERKVKTMNN